ncbi:cysteine desulfurase NifS, partial [Streptomyces rochei]
MLEAVDASSSASHTGAERSRADRCKVCGTPASAWAPDWGRTAVHWLGEHAGATVEYLPVDAHGRVHPEA